jgi:serine/threonine-protein kinase
MVRAGDGIGPYTLISKLGSGAHGVVWLAERRTTITTTEVAVKIPLNDDFDIEVIKQEADLWVKASGHPNILPIIEANIYQDQVVIVSEYAPGGSLSSWLKQNEYIPLEIAIEMTCGILSGLEHLHSKKIIHRDLKPDNILLQGETPRLADFGISRILRSNTQSSLVVGTPAYMSPETFFGKHTLQTDLWAAAVILYRLVSGQMPFPQTNLPILMRAIIEQPPSALPESIPVAIREVIMKALEKNPSHRYQSASEMRKVLKQAYKSVRSSRANQKIDIPVFQESVNAQEALLNATPVVDGKTFVDKTKSLYPYLVNNLAVADILSISSDVEIDSENIVSDFAIHNTNTSNNVRITNQELLPLITLQDKTFQEDLLKYALNSEQNSLNRENIVTYPIAKTKLLQPFSHEIVFLESVSKINVTIKNFIQNFYTNFSKIKFDFFTSLLSSLSLSIIVVKKWLRYMPKQMYVMGIMLCFVSTILINRETVYNFYKEVSDNYSINILSKTQHISSVKASLSASDQKNQSANNDTPVLIGYALSEVNETIERIEKEIPPSDPVKVTYLVRFRSFRQGLKTYYTGDLDNLQARQYAESALSQAKSLHKQLNSKKTCSIKRKKISQTVASFKKKELVNPYTSK